MAQTVFGKYVVASLLGRGGMAEVYEGYHPDLDRRVAIKVILPQFAAHDGFDERFRHEARLVASLRHAHIVQLYDFDVVDDRLFMVMEHLEGGTLKDRLSRLRSQGRTYPLDETAGILAALATALDYAHGRGMVHRDIKPANILFTGQNEPVLTDFGIAKLLGGAVQLTMTGGVVGSPAYMSPEQATGGDVDARSDQYALGVVLYEMVTGQVPFRGDSPTAVMLQHLNKLPPPPRSLSPALPEAVQTVILRSLAKAPAARFPSIGDLAQAFQSALGKQPGMATQAADAQEATVLDAGAATAGDRTVPANGISSPSTGAVRPATQDTGAMATVPSTEAATATDGRVEPPPAPEQLPAVSLVAREAELDRLEKRWQAARAGQGHTVFVTGEAGMGKSTLVNAFIARIAAAWQAGPSDVSTSLQIARGRCSPQFGREEAFLPFAETLADLLAGKVRSQQGALDTYTLVQDSAPAWMAIVPVVGDMLGGMLEKARSMHRAYGSAQEAGAGQPEQHMLQQYTNALLALARRGPVLLFLDDLQWADSATVSLLVHLARQIARHPVLLVGTYRPSDVDVAGHPLRQARRELDRYKVCTEIALSTFERAGFDALVDDYLPGQALPRRFLDRLFQQTGGVPFFIAETLVYLQEDGGIQLVDGRWHLAGEGDDIDLPASVEAVIEKRLERLEEEQRKALQYASVEGDQFTSSVLAGLLETDELDLEDQLEQVEKVHHLIRFAGEIPVGEDLASRYQYSHALFHRALYESLRGKRLRLLHRRVGEALESLYGDDVEAVAHQLAFHFELGHVPEKALAYSLQAAQRSLHLYAWDEAELGFRRLERLAEHAQDPDRVALQVAEGMGDVALARAQYQEALDHFESALSTLDLALVEDENEVRARLHRKRARTYEHLGNLNAAFAALEEGLRHAPDGSLELAALYLMGAGLHYRHGRFQEALNYCDMASSVGDLPKVHPIRAHVKNLTCLLYTYIGRTQEAFEPLNAALRIYEKLEDLAGQCDTCTNLAAAHLARSEPGDWLQARQYDEKALKLAERINDTERIARAYADLGWTTYCLGDDESAIQAYRNSLAIWTESGARLKCAIVTGNLGAAELARGHTEQALELLATAAATLEEIGARGQLGETYCYLALAHLANGDPANAQDHAESALELAHSEQNELDVAIAQRLLGHIAVAEGELDTASAALDTSRAALEALGNRYEIGQTSLVQAQLSAKQGDQQRALAELDTSIREFTALGAARDLRRANTLALAIRSQEELPR